MARGLLFYIYKLDRVVGVFLREGQVISRISRERLLEIL